MRIIRRRIAPLCALGVLSAVAYLSPSQQEPPTEGRFVSLYVKSSTKDYMMPFYIGSPELFHESRLVTKLFENN